LHRADRLGIAFGLWHSEIPILSLLRITALLMTYEQHRHSMKRCEAANDRRIISKAAITVNFGEVLKHALDEIERMRPLRMTGKLHPLKSRARILLIFFFGHFGLGLMGSSRARREALPDYFAIQASQRRFDFDASLDLQTCMRSNSHCHLV